MKYLCPSCGKLMHRICMRQIPLTAFYRCDCGFKSKMIQEKPECMYLPKELWAEEGEDEIQYNG